MDTNSMSDQKSDSPDSSSNGLSPPIVIGLIVAGTGIVILVVICVVCMFWRKSKARTKDEMSDDGGFGLKPDDIKIQTLGRNYKINSIPNAENTDESRKTSACSTHSHNHHEVAPLLTNGSSHPERLDVVKHSNEPFRILDRATSTYIEPRTIASLSRQSSNTSQNMTMEEVTRSINPSAIIDRTRKEDPAARAPLADAESLFSAESMDIPNEIPASVLKSGLKSSTRRNPHGVGEFRRPQSDGITQEKRYVPKLPPKTRRGGGGLNGKTTGNGNRSSSQIGQVNDLKDPVGSSSRSKSENCLFTVAEDLDYDDLPESMVRPVLPPKSVPHLPPKQIINKSQNDLETIDHNFKSSLSELAQKLLEEDVDYDDPPPKESAEIKNGNRSEFGDYDEPISQ
eukprot:TCALIF_05724-PA protein Name:"Protein of unknown function" AED:0.01 eAED:0.01 QI:685/1/0.8/1/1/1/5/0/397